MSLPARVVLTAGFVSTGLFCVHRCVGGSTALRWPARVDYGMHALMSVSMIAMAWASSPFASWQTTAFTIAVCWFLLRAAGPSLSTASARVVVAGADPPPAAGGCSARHPTGALVRRVHHAVVMAAMAWSVSIMSAGSTMTHDAGTPHASSPGTRYVAAVGAGYCLVVAVLIAVGARVRLLTAAGRRGVAGELHHALMAAGMAVMLFAML